MMKDHNFWKRKGVFSVLLVCLLGSTNAGYASDPEHAMTSGGTTGTLGVNLQQQQQRITIRGNIMDTKSEPLAGVHVILKGDNSVATVSDLNGDYTIQVPSKNVSLEFIYMGMATQEQRVGSRQIINVIMQEDENLLEEVVVVGFGTQKKESVVGSISTIRPASLQKGTSRSLSNNLIGQLSGVIGSQRSGEPGYDGASFFIRGISTFNGNNNPLILVDGVERSLDNIDPAEIESFSILKDAAASAVYGVRGANGVILINTKRGKIGKPSVDIRFEQGITFLGKTPDYIGAYDYASLVNAIAKEEGNQIPYSQEDLEKYRTGSDPDLYPDVNWIDAITKKFGTNSRVNLDVTGGSDILRYSLVGSYYNTRGIMDRDKSYEWDNSDRLNRFSLRSNVDVNITPTYFTARQYRWILAGSYLVRR